MNCQKNLGTDSVRTGTFAWERETGHVPKTAMLSCLFSFVVMFLDVEKRNDMLFVNKNKAVCVANP